MPWSHIGLRVPKSGLRGAWRMPEPQRKPSVSLIIRASFTLGGSQRNCLQPRGVRSPGKRRTGCQHDLRNHRGESLVGGKSLNWRSCGISKTTCHHLLYRETSTPWAFTPGTASPWPCSDADGQGIPGHARCGHRHYPGNRVETGGSNIQSPFTRTPARWW